MKNDPNEQLAFDFTNSTMSKPDRTFEIKPHSLTLVHSRSPDTTIVSDDMDTSREMILSDVVSYAKSLSW